MSGYSRAHYRRVSPPADTSAEIAARRKRLEALDIAAREMRERFPKIDQYNFQDANDYRENLYRELMAEGR